MQTPLPYLLIKKARHLLPGKSQAKVALTFDDGPDFLTERYLDLLDELSVRATFFLVGKQAKAQPHLRLEYIRRGHEVMGHGFTHRSFPSLSSMELKQELFSTREVLPMGPPMGLSRDMVRPPYGKVDLKVVLGCALSGFSLLLWNQDSLDYKVKDPAALAAGLRKRPLRGGDVLLFHEGQPWTLEALPEIVSDLRGRGLIPTTVSDVFG